MSIQARFSQAFWGSKRFFCASLAISGRPELSSVFVRSIGADQFVGIHHRGQHQAAASVNMEAPN
jgi:hypothetical protein